MSKFDADHDRHVYGDEPFLMRGRTRTWFGAAAPGIGILAGLVVLAIAVLALAGCSRPVQVSATIKWPTPPPVACVILPVPDPVAIPAFDDPDRPERLYITHRQWYDFQIYQVEERDFMRSVAECLAKLAPPIKAGP